MGQTESFYGQKINTFYNSIYSLDSTIKTHFSSMLLNDDLTRMVYASNSFAFKERARKNEGNLNLPFVNFWHSTISPDTIRFLWNHMANIEGIYDNTLQRKLKIVPVHITYESSFWVNRFEDLLYAQSQLLTWNSNETLLYFSLQANNSTDTIKFPAFITYNLNFRPNYQEQDWLEQNKIQTIAIDFEVDTLLISDNTDIGLTNEILFTLYATYDPDFKTKDIEDLDSVEIISELYKRDNPLFS